MSRVGRSPIAVPSGVTIQINGQEITVKGPKGTISRAVHPEMNISQEDGHLVVSRPSDSTQHKALHGLTRALVNNAVVGASEGFTKILELRGVGYRAEATPKALNMSLGYSHPVSLPLPEGVTVETTPSTPTTENGFLASTITIRCHDKQVLGDFAADVRGKRPVEPYKGKGLRYKNEVVKRKLGKQAKSDKKK
ncbi:MAG: 50S ribosomal protein L6 [Abitibacteriaceae bacterium]|nr:50S ribosomal protein L6 [Abditibacteriaceae bacterium]MBV9865959.1 50S ribosomal protein L6 [Abditibacteriaceae bacterium]